MSPPTTDASAFALDLPHGRCVGMAIPETLTAELLAELHPEEQRLVASMAPARQPTFAAGRVALRRALASAGLVEASRGPLLLGARGEPRLPAGALGSISHKRTRERGLAVGLAIPTPPSGQGRSDVGVGVDVEQSRRLVVDISRRVLTEGELERWQANPSQAGRDRDLITIFSLKEAFYKAVNGFLQRFVPWRAVEVASIDDQGRVSFAGRLLEDNPLLTVDGCIRSLGESLDGFILCSARACWSARD